MEFDEWLIGRLVANGALCLGDPAPNVPAALILFQESEGLPLTGLADTATVNLLRRHRSLNPASDLIIFRPAPPRAGSLYTPKELAA